MSSADLLPPETMTLQAAGERLLSAFDVGEHAVVESDRTYYDTFDGLLRARGLSVVHENGRLALIDRHTGVVRAAIPAVSPGHAILPMNLDDGPLRQALLPIVDVRALLAVAQVHSRVRGLDVLDDRQKTVVRITLEEPAVVGSRRRAKPLRPRVRLGAVRGYDNELAAVRHQLEQELLFTPADQTLVDEAVRAAGGEPAGISSKVEVALARDQRADAATVAVLRALLGVIEANVEGTIDDIDAEFLHDFRVSVRRSRAVQRELRGVFPPADLATFRNEFRWLQQITGDARDLDVYVLSFHDMRALVPAQSQADLDPLLTVLRERRLTARAAMVKALRSHRSSRLLAEWSAFLEELVERDTADRPDAERPIDDVAGGRIARVYGRMVKMGRAIDRASPAADYHELRKKGKELRYLLELFGAPLYPPDVVRPMIKSLKALQDVLGRHQDREVQVATLRALRDEVATLPGGPGALMAMGVLVERLGEDEQAARSEFAESFAAFAAKSQRLLVKETFAA
jgi:CHAD domain-containing protein